MLNNLNEWQDIVRDRTPPSLSIVEGVVAKVPFGTNSFSPGLLALDDGEDISYDIQPNEGFDTFIPNGSTPVDFTITDKGGNRASLSREVSVIGSWAESTTAFYDFTKTSNLLQSFTAQNGEWETSEEGLKPVGDMPDSPRWVITSDVDANCDFQVAYTANGEGYLLGLVYRFVDVQNFSWVYLKDGELAVRERINGTDVAIASDFVSNFSADQEYVVGITVENKNLSVYVDGVPKIATKVNYNIFSRKFGVLLVNANSLITKAQFAQPNALTHGFFYMNAAPTANAGPDQSVAAGELVQVSASGSTDGDGTIVGWKWRETTNSGVTLSSTTAENISFTSPVSDTAQTVTLELIVTNDKGADSAPVYVNFNVAAEGYLFDDTIDYIRISSGVGTVKDYSLEQVSLYQYSDNFILCNVTNEKNEVLDPSLFQAAEYRLTDKRGENIFTATLDNGLSVLGDAFQIHINDEVLNKSHKGSFKHQFVVWSQSGYKLPPVFGGKVSIVSVLEPLQSEPLV